MCCLLAPPCCVILLLVGTSLLCILDVRFAPPCCALLLLVGTSLLCVPIARWHLLAMHSYVRFAPPCCALLLLVGTSLLCVHVVHWHLLAMHFWCFLVLFKLVFHSCIFLCRCGRKQFSASFSTPKYFSNFFLIFISLKCFFFLIFFIFLLFLIFCYPNLLSKMCLEFIF